MNVLGPIVACVLGQCVDPPTGPGVLVAFIGDQSDGSNADAVLQLMLDEGVNLVVHAGDFDYGNNPTVWRDQIEAVFGPCPPYVAVAGNHDDQSSVWPQYRQVIEDWLVCNGESYAGVAGEMFSLTWEGVFLALVSPGLFPGDHAGFLSNQLAANDAIWSVASWHLLMRDMQIGGKLDQSGWGVYEAARQGGAIVHTAHEHSYHRTNLLSSMENQTVVGSDLVLSEGETFAFVSGLGGFSIRDQERCFPTFFPYGCNGTWASIYAEQQGADFGALFIEFGFNDNPCLAHGYFKDINGFIADEFFITSTLGGCGRVTAAMTDDILWRHDDGQTIIWLMDGTLRIGQGSPGGANPDDWEVAGVGDFDGDGHADILWRHQDSGQVAVWFINGTQFAGGGSVGVVSLDWTIEGIVNFDGSGGDDILWRHTSGVTFIWLMNGTNVVGQGSPGGVGQVWQIAGVGDFDGDGHGDILWRNTSTGQVVIWFIEGTQQVASGPAGSADPNVWEIAGVGDFDGLASTATPTADMLWRHTSTGQTVIWLMDGTLRIGQGSPGGANPDDWEVAGVGDLDADGRSDILWRHQAGQVFAWFIECTDRVGQSPLGGVPPVWQIAGIDDFDGE